jgi:hypothetical protein
MGETSDGSIGESDATGDGRESGRQVSGEGDMPKARARAGGVGRSRGMAGAGERQEPALSSRPSDKRAAIAALQSIIQSDMIEGARPTARRECRAGPPIEALS